MTARLAPLAGVVSLLLTSTPHAQSWETYQIQDYQLEFDLPGPWAITLPDAPEDPATITAVSPDGVERLVIRAYRAPSQPASGLLAALVTEAGIALDASPADQNFNTLQAQVASGTATLDGVASKVSLLAAASEQWTCVAYVAAEATHFDANRTRLTAILLTFKPLPAPVPDGGVLAKLRLTTHEKPWAAAGIVSGAVSPDPS
jgi:hypothetical protein